MDIKTNNVIDFCTEYVANILSASPILSAVPILVENRRDIEFEIKNALGRQGIVCVVMCEKATFVGKYEDNSLAWQLDDLIVEFVENIPVNRYPEDKDYVTGQACGMEAFRCLCPLSGDYEGQFQPVDYQHGEDSSLIVTKCKFKCLAHLTGEYIPPPPRPGPIPIPTYDELISAVNEISVGLSVVSSDVQSLSANFNTLSSELSNLNERELMHYNLLSDQLSNCWKKTDELITAGAFHAHTISSSLLIQPHQIRKIDIAPRPNVAEFTFPSHSGTLATVQDISSYVPSVDLANISCQNLTATQYLSATRADTGFLSAQGITIKQGGTGIHEPEWFIDSYDGAITIQNIKGPDYESVIRIGLGHDGEIVTDEQLNYAESTYYNDSPVTIQLWNREAVYCMITELNNRVDVVNGAELEEDIPEGYKLHDSYITFNNLLSTDFTDIHLSAFGTIYIPEDENEEDILTVPAKSVKQFYITKIPETQSYALATRVLKSTSL